MADFRVVRRGWCLGDETFRKELQAQMSGRIGAEHYGPERAETALEKAECIIAVELKRRCWTEESLRQRLKGDAGKVRIAECLRAETTQTVGWIAEGLYMSSLEFRKGRRESKKGSARNSRD